MRFANIRLSPSFVWHVEFMLAQQNATEIVRVIKKLLHFRNEISAPFLPPYKNRLAPYKIINGDTGIPSLH